LFIFRRKVSDKFVKSKWIYIVSAITVCENKKQAQNSNFFKNVIFIV